MNLPEFKTFEQYIDEDRNNEYNANRQMTSTSSLPAANSVRHNAPFAAINNKEEKRKQELHSAAIKHVAKGDTKQAHAAAYTVAHAHAIEDRHSPESAHEVATRKATYAVKKAQEAMKR